MMTKVSSGIQTPFTETPHGFIMPRRNSLLPVPPSYHAWFASQVSRFFAATLITTSIGLLLPRPALAAPHRYDHVVIVMEENRTAGQIIGDRVNAPYINTLADGGVRFGAMFAIEHPSQPNYLQLFSGANQGVVDDNLPPNFSTTPISTYPFTTANLGAELIAAGFTFAGYCEELETAGAADWADYDPHSATHPGIYYRRKHNPWANWIAKTSPIPANQLPATVNRAFIQFPTNFNELPTVSFIVPNQLHDMHDGSRKQGDDWLAANLSDYAEWAKTNNSLLIITWDEDDYNEDNQIPTIFYGSNLRDGTAVKGTWTLHHLLRTLEDMYGVTAHAGTAAQLRSIVGPFTGDPNPTILSLRQGLNGYAAARDTQLWQEAPDTSFAAAQDLGVDLDSSSSLAGNQEAQALVRFDSIFGTGTNQIPINAVIHSAKLLLQTPLNTTGTDYDSNDPFRAHRMIADWNDGATWNTFVNGVSPDGVEAASASSFTLVPDVDGGPAVFDVTSDLELFKAGTPNRGWLLRPSSSGTGDGWTFKSSEATTDATLRPTLEIVYSLPVTTYASWSLARGLSGTNSAPTADPDGDGVDNLAEFSYNLNPLLADFHYMTPNGTNGLPTVRYLPNTSGGILQVQYVRRKSATVSGLTYGIQFSGNLATWSTNQTSAASSLNADWERVTVRDVVPGPNPNRFARLILTLQP